MKTVLVSIAATLLLTGCTSKYGQYVEAIKEVNGRPMVSIQTDANTSFRGKIVVYERPIVPTKPRDTGEQIKDVLTGVTPLAIGLAGLKTMESAIDSRTTVTNTEVVTPEVVRPEIVQVPVVE